MITEAIAFRPLPSEDPNISLPEVRTKIASNVIVSRVNQYLAENQHISEAALARAAGVSPSALNRYMNHKPEGNVEKLEALLLDVLKAAEERKAFGAPLFETQVTKMMNGAFETIRRSNDMGGIFGDGGLGKTCGCQIYVRDHPTALLITVSEWAGGGNHMRNLIRNQVDTRGWRRRFGTIAEYLVKKFKGSDRLFIVDECHELKPAGRRFWRHFHDATGCPICYVGNESFIDKVEDDSQHFSRLGYKKILSADVTEVTAELLVMQEAPDAWKEIKDLALQVISEGGHARSLRKQLRLANEIRRQTGKDLRTCFLAAHHQLIRNYKLKS